MKFIKSVSQTEIQVFFDDNGKIKTKILDENDYSIINKCIKIIKTRHPKAYDFLYSHFNKHNNIDTTKLNFLIARRFIMCNINSFYNNLILVNEEFNFHFASECPLKGECNLYNIVCILNPLVINDNTDKPLFN